MGKGFFCFVLLFLEIQPEILIEKEVGFRGVKWSFPSISMHEVEESIII